MPRQGTNYEMLTILAPACRPRVLSNNGGAGTLARKARHPLDCSR